MRTTTIKDFFKQLRIIHAALILGQVIFVIITFTVLEEPLEHDEIKDWETVAPWLLGAVAVLFYAMSRIVVQFKVNRVKNRESIGEKLQGYRESMILRWALLETPSFIGIIGAYMTNESIYLLFPLAFIVMQVLEAPSDSKAVAMLALDVDDRGIVADPAHQIKVKN